MIGTSDFDNFTLPALVVLVAIDNFDDSDLAELLLFAPSGGKFLIARYLN
jgi:hypothetical protein